VPRRDSKQRSRILEAAVSVFAERGLDGATIRLVGRKASVNSALMYYYFENKDDLFDEALRYVLMQFLEQAGSHRPSFSGGRQRIEFLVDLVLDYYSWHPERMRLMVIAFSMHPQQLGAALRDVLRTSPLVPIEILLEGMAAGHLRHANPVHTWWSLMGMCLFGLNMSSVLGNRLDWLPVPGGVRMQDRRNEIIELVARGLAVPARVRQGKGSKQ
jgi:TetR/AcrR family transcriptional regulator